MISMKSLSKVILFCLMVSPVFVNAGEGEEDEGRDSACARMGRGALKIVGAPLAFVGFVGASLAGVAIASTPGAVSVLNALQSQAQEPEECWEPILCERERRFMGPIFCRDADVCGPKGKSLLYSNGALMNRRCYGLTTMFDPLWVEPGTRITIPDKAKRARKRALEKRDLALAKDCELFLDTLRKGAIVERDYELAERSLYDEKSK